MDTAGPSPAPRRAPRDNGPQLRRRFLEALGPPDRWPAPDAPWTPELVDAARAAWQRLADRGHWSPSYRRRALTSLVRALEGDQPGLARAISPNAKPRRFRDRVVHTESSHETRFYVQDCLPLRVRHQSAQSVAYQVLFGLTERLLKHCRSACRHTLQKRLLFLYRLLRLEPSLLHEGQSVAVAWERLGAVSGLTWLRRLEALYGTRPAVAPHTLHVHLTLLRLLHEQLLGPRTDGDTLPTTTGPTVLEPLWQGDDEDDDGDPYDEAPPIGDPDHHAKLRVLGALRRRLRPGAALPAAPPPPRQWAFRPDEVLAILDAALTTPERLIVLLLVTTGLRLGGLCRLRTTTRAHWGHEIPVEALHTVEKGNRPRNLVLLAPVRICLARYFREDQRDVTGCLVFPAARDPTQRSLHPTNMWQRIRVVLRRAGLTGPHAHPHTFRHTYVHMMRLMGVPTEIIAKMIGHANLQTTERVYSRFDPHELSSLAAGVPIFGGSVAAAQVSLRERWQEVVTRINCPYEFSEKEWFRLK